MERLKTFGYECFQFAIYGCRRFFRYLQQENNSSQEFFFGHARIKMFVICRFVTCYSNEYMKEPQKLQILLANFDSELQRITGN